MMTLTSDYMACNHGLHEITRKAAISLQITYGG